MITKEEIKEIKRLSSPYNGGKFINAYGYVQFCFKDDTGKTITPVEHRMVMEYTLGRKLRKTELVHHINGNKRDNREENLILMTRPQHLRLHNIDHPWKSLNKLTFLKKDGIILNVPKGTTKNKEMP